MVSRLEIPQPAQVSLYFKFQSGPKASRVVLNAEKCEEIQEGKSSRGFKLPVEGSVMEV